MPRRNMPKATRKQRHRNAVARDRARRKMSAKHDRKYSGKQGKR